jgi:hypothetical protein
MWMTILFSKRDQKINGLMVKMLFIAGIVNCLLARDSFDKMPRTWRESSAPHECFMIPRRFHSL